MDSYIAAIKCIQLIRLPFFFVIIFPSLPDNEPESSACCCSQRPYPPVTGTAFLIIPSAFNLLSFSSLLFLLQRSIRIRGRSGLITVTIIICRFVSCLIILICV